ncbi:hypothetical protein J3R30DRAFT_1613089 [Lentinula aciculospora]|uniref:Uncharacterized protein n=1 Tax=Lentinula aciculospora TaxID=153920 RepID=A0A9W9DG06_9AGAR|nr:hypothetical protein J3R30DRAFT_1613089 [Lentinula aciculospora]
MDSLGPAGWTSIRPWIPPLSLSVHEITSVSVTFVLSAATLDPNSETELSLAGVSISTEDIHQDEDGADDEDTNASESEAKKTLSVVSSALNGGLSVEVDRSSWRRVFIRIDDKADEAVIIVYGLLPGRQYEIVLELVQGGQTNSIRQQVTTEENENKDSNASDSDSTSKSTVSASSDANGSSICAQPGTPPDSSGSVNQMTSSPGFSFAPLTLEDRLNQLEHTLSLLNSEQASLTATIKSSRRDSQKADATLRSEIDVLKRASERYLSSEQRSKQKVLALQEAVKRAQTVTREMEMTMKEVNGEIPGLKEEKQQREAEHKQVKEAANKMRREKDARAEQEKKRIESMKNESNILTKQLEKLEVKKEKLEGNVIKDLEEQLENIEKEMEHLEREEEELSNGSCSQPTTSQFVGPNWGPPGRHIEEDVPQSSDPGTIGRPSPNSLSNSSSIQRPRGLAHPPSSLSMSHWTPISPSRQSQHHQPQSPNHVNQRSSSLPQPNQNGNSHHPHQVHHHSQQHQHNHSQSHSYYPARTHQPSPTTILMNPNRQNLKNTPGGSVSLPAVHPIDPSEALSNNSILSPGIGFIPSGVSTPSTTGSTLSSRAPPFEPGRVIIRRSTSRSRTRVGM